MKGKRIHLFPTLVTLAVTLVSGLALTDCDREKAASRIRSQPESTRDFFSMDRTAYGFFPSPPEWKLESILDLYVALGRHADFVLYQREIPWEDFLDGVEGESQSREDIRNQTILARRNGLDWVFVVDPLNGLNRQEFQGLPPGWEASFANPDVRAAFTHFTLWILREFESRCLGLASEINTYMDAHPGDAKNYMSLYSEVYDSVKAEAPDTLIFVTFQWEDLNNMFRASAEGRPARRVNWEQIEAFEPKLDLWAISSYPYFVFEEGGIPEDYYTPLRDRTTKPIAVAECGWSTAKVASRGGSEEGQSAFLETIHSQLGGRLAFWVYLILDDLNMDSIGPALEELGRSRRDLETLSLFVSMGLRSSKGKPKEALALWDSFREPE